MPIPCDGWVEGAPLAGNPQGASRVPGAGWIPDDGKESVAHAITSNGGAPADL